MQLFTPVPIAEHQHPIDYGSHILMLGSCFSEHIAARLQHSGFSTVSNPFGIIFNPQSIRVLLERCMLETSFTSRDVHEGFSYFAHSRISAPTNTQVLNNLNHAASIVKNAVQSASHIYITLATAWVYRLKTSGMVVANCHKQPQILFDKELLETKMLEADMSAMVKLIAQHNPTARVTFTLSPIRHLKDGFIENHHSKARLFDAIINSCKSHGCSYFPSYEIVMDQLRDYRFYAPDMIHLNSVGIDFVWSRFRESGINQGLLPVMNRVEKFRKLEAHRPSDHVAHRQQVLERRQHLLREHPEVTL